VAVPSGAGPNAAVARIVPSTVTVVDATWSALRPRKVALMVSVLVAGVVGGELVVRVTASVGWSAPVVRVMMAAALHAFAVPVFDFDQVVGVEVAGDGEDLCGQREQHGQECEPGGGDGEDSGGLGEVGQAGGDQAEPGEQGGEDADRGHDAGGGGVQPLQRFGRGELGGQRLQRLFPRGWGTDGFGCHRQYRPRQTCGCAPSGGDPPGQDTGTANWRFFLPNATGGPCSSRLCTTCGVRSCPWVGQVKLAGSRCSTCPLRSLTRACGGCRVGSPSGTPVGRAAV
jgi:hypothetical protein